MRIKAYLAVFLLLTVSCSVISQATKKTQERKKTVVTTMAARKLSHSLELKAGEKVMSFPASAFRPHNPQPEQFWVIAKGVLMNPSDYSIGFSSPVMLPHGSEIQRIVLICKDPAERQHWDVTMTLVCTDNLGEPAYGENEHQYFIVTMSTSGASDGWRMVKAEELKDPIIDHLNNTYYLSLTLAPNCEFRQIKIFYK